MHVSKHFRAFARHRGIRERVLAPFSFDALILGTNLVTGIIVARELGTAGRGQIAATLVLVYTATWIFSVGSTNAASYHQSLRPADASILIGSWLIVALTMSLFAIVITELLLPVLFAAQSESAISLARLYIPFATFSLVLNVFNGILLGSRDFLAYNVIRTLIPTIIALAYLVLLLVGSLSVESALAANAGASVLATSIAMVRCVRRYGVSKPNQSFLRRTTWYGLRAHGGSIAGFVNARLDLLIIPAFLSSASVGLYSVATNATSIIGALTGTIAIFVLPVAARRQHGSARTVIRTLQATVMIGLVIAIPLGLLANVALSLLYGSEFEGASTALRVMLPGEVLDAGSVVLYAGLMAANRPFLSSVAAVPGAFLTVTGLILFLQAGGIVAAATVTSVVYGIVFVITIILYRRLQGLRWRDFLMAPTDVVPSAPNET